MKNLNTADNFICSVDDEDYDRLCKYTWHRGKGSVARTFRVGHRTIRVSLASEVMQNINIMYDHVDRNPLNNNKSNLRPANYSQNGGNRTKQLGTTSKYKGVYWDRASKKWHARIQLLGKRIQLGRYASEELAAKAYDDSAVLFFKEFANLNFK